MYSLPRKLTHETSREAVVSADLVVDLDKTLHKDSLDFAAVKGVLETVSQENDERQALAGLVGTGAGLRGVRTCQSINLAKQHCRS